MLAVSAWAAQAEGKRDEAVKLMRAAADNEDASVKHVAMENRLYPMRELYADLLLQQGQAPAALREFETALKETPNRYRALFGDGRAAELAGDRATAVGYYEKLWGSPARPTRRARRSRRRRRSSGRAERARRPRRG